MSSMKAPELTPDETYTYYERRLGRSLRPNPSDECRCQCLFHDDSSPSLGINVRSGLWNCFAGCGGGSVFDFEMRLGDCKFKEARKRVYEVIGRAKGSVAGNGGKIVPEYNYRDEQGEVLYQMVRRYKPKRFSGRHPDGSGGWIYNLNGVRRVPYHLPDVIAASEVYIAEGEKDCDRLASLGIVATTNSEGAGKWLPEFAAHFHGKRVVILPDNDEPGRRHAEQVAAFLLPVAASVKTVKLDGLPPHGDISDWLDAGHTREELLALVEQTPCWQGRQPLAALDLGPDLIRDAERFISRFLSLPPDTLLPVTLWALCTHMCEAFDAFPYLAILSPTKGCGKTRLTEVITMLVQNPVMTVGISEAALFRLVAKEKPTLILDEAEFLVQKSDRAESIRALLNSGNRKGASVPRCAPNTHEIQKFSIYCPKVICGIGGCPETIRDRSIMIIMQRRQKGEATERFRPRKVEPEGERLRERIAAFAIAQLPAIQEVYDKMDLGDTLGTLSDRDVDSWEPLFAVLGMADPTRLDELQRCAEVLTGQKRAADEDDSWPLKLLSDIRKVWPEGQRNMLTAELLIRLHRLEESPWDERLDDRKLARTLRPFGVQSGQVRDGNISGKGYRLGDLEAVFERYLAPEGKQEKQPA